MSDQTTYYHGGQRGLRKGDLIKPTMLTKASSTRQYGAAHVCRADRVYVATLYEAALMFAALHPSRGFVYRVEPIGTLESDPDFTGPDGISLQCEFARILEVIRPTPEEITAVHQAMFVTATNDAMFTDLYPSSTPPDAP